MPPEDPKSIPAKHRLIVALDYPDQHAALNLVDTLEDAVTFYKVGYELFLAAGWPVIDALAERNKKIFLDLKMDDIEATVEKGIASIARRPAIAITTINGGAPTARAAKRGKGGAEHLSILQITLLTSLGKEDLEELGLVGEGCRFASEPDYVEWRARQALENGADGLIASGQSAQRLRGALGPDFTLVCPGIRPAEDLTDDHKRPYTPQDAIRDGANRLVVGRPIRNDPDPKAKAERIVAEIQQGLDSRD